MQAPVSRRERQVCVHHVRVCESTIVREQDPLNWIPLE